MRRSVAAGCLALGVVAGWSAALLVAAPTTVPPADTPLPPAVARPVATTTTTTTGPPPSTWAPEPEDTTYVVWATGGLTPELTAGLTASFEAVSVVKGDVVDLSTGGDSLIPLDALGIDQVAHRPFDPSGELTALRPGTVVLGETSADLRGTAVDDVLVLAGRPYRVAGVVSDDVVAAAEVVFALSDPNLPVVTDRFALVAATVPRTEFEAAVRSLHDGPAPLRVRAEGETPWLRHGDAVLPQALVKKALGEFGYTQRTSSGFVQDASFVDEHIVTVEVPVLGEVVCHQVVAGMLAGAMADLAAQGLTHLVDPAGFAGCWNARFVRSASGTPSGVSRHSWGAAVDINAPGNPVGTLGTQDPRLIDVMLAHGFTWGGDWLVPDPMHFEYGIDPG